jgi:hypothetical protein
MRISLHLLPISCLPVCLNYPSEQPALNAHNLRLLLNFPNNVSHQKVFHIYKANGVFWDVTLCGYCKIRRFGGT